MRAALLLLLLALAACTTPRAPRSDAAPSREAPTPLKQASPQEAPAQPLPLPPAPLPRGFAPNWALPVLATPAAPTPIAQATAHVDPMGALAVVTLELRLHNATSSTQEGRWTLDLPPDATIEALSLDVEGRAMPGILVPWRSGAAIYGSIVQRSQDPALLTEEAPGRYSLRVFPLPPREDRRLTLRWTEPLPDLGDARVYRPPRLDGAAPLAVRVAGQPRWEGTAGEAPALLLPSSPAPPVYGSTAAVTLRPPARPASQRPSRGVLLLVDLPADAHPAAALAQVRRSLQALAPAAPLLVLHGAPGATLCDPAADPDGCLPRAAGASDPAALLQAAAHLLQQRDAPPLEVLYLGDLRPTLGPPLDGALQPALDTLHALGARLHTAALSPRADLAALTRLASRGGGGLWLDALRAQAPDANALYQAPAPTPLHVEASPGLERLTPPLEPVPAGATATITATLAAPSARLDLRWGSGHDAPRQSIALDRQTGADPLQAYAAASHLRLLYQRGAPADDLRAQALEQRLLTPDTALLALESDAMAARFGLDPTSARTVGPPPAAPRAAQPQRSSAGLQGQLRSNPAPVLQARIPQLRVAEATVSGYLDTSIIRRVIRQHTPRLRACYQRALQRDPALKGRLVIRLGIDEGRIIEATSTQNELNDAEVTDCILADALTWAFPVPQGGGHLRVTYPFQFNPEGTPPPGTPMIGSRLATLLITDPAQARAALQQHLSEHPDDPAAQLRAFTAATVRAAFPDLFWPVARARLHLPSPPPGLPEATFLHDLTSKDLPLLLNTLQHNPPPSPSAGALLDAARRRLPAAQARQIADAWLPHLTPADLWRALDHRPTLNAFLPHATFDAARDTLQHDPADLRVLQILVDAGLSARSFEPLAHTLDTTCADPRAPREACLAQTRRAHAAYPPLRPLLARLLHERITELEALRTQHPGNLAVLLPLALLYSELERPPSAIEALSEGVQLHPDDPALRRQLAALYLKHNQPTAACSTLLTPALTSPRQLALLGDLLEMIRKNPAHRDPLNACVLNGVARLTRGSAAALLFLQHEPAADIQLTPDAGELQVLYQHTDGSRLLTVSTLKHPLTLRARTTGEPSLGQLWVLRGDDRQHLPLSLRPGPAQPLTTLRPR